MTSTYYVSTGAQDKMFTLRVQEPVTIYVEGLPVEVMADYYIRNLSTDAEKAVKVANILGYKVSKPKFTLQEIERKNKEINQLAISQKQEELEKAELDRKLSREKSLLNDIAQTGCWSFGKYKGDKVEWALDYAMFWLKLESNDSFVIGVQKLINVLCPKAAELVELAKGNGKHFGTIKKRVKGLTGTCVSVFGYESFYGFVYLSFIALESGEIVFYKGSTYQDINVGDSVTFDATPAEHTEYEGVIQTKMSRFKFH